MVIGTLFVVLMLRQITISTTLGNGTPLPLGTLTCIPIEQIVTGGQNVAVTEFTFVITNGTIPPASAIVAPGWYSFEIWDTTSSLQCFQAYVPEGTTSISLYDLYISSYSDPPTEPGVVYLTDGSSILLLTPGGGTDGQVLTRVGGALAWADPAASGSGGETTLVTAFETLNAGEFVTVYNNAGTLRVRTADHSDVARIANGFVLSGVAAAAIATVYPLGARNSALAGLTPGLIYLLGPAGGVTTVVTTTTAQFYQKLGTATSATAILTESHPAVVRA